MSTLIAQTIYFTALLSGAGGGSGGGELKGFDHLYTFGYIGRSWDIHVDQMSGSVAAGDISGGGHDEDDEDDTVNFT